MAKKFRCSTCGNIVTIDPAREVLSCPYCGKKYRNSFYDPTAPRPEYMQMAQHPQVYYKTAYMPQETKPVQEPVQQQPHPAMTEDQNDLLLEEEEQDLEELNDENEEETDEDEYTDEQWNRIVKLKAKKSGSIALLIFSFVLIAAAALICYVKLTAQSMEFGSVIDWFKAGIKSDIVGDVLKTDILWTDVLVLLPYALISLGIMILAAMHISIANIKLRCVDDDVDRSRAIKSGKQAAYAFLLIFSILVMVFGGMMSVGGLVANDVLGGDGGDLLNKVLNRLGSVYFFEFALGLIGIAYFAHRIDLAGKQYKLSQSQE